jgi:hypothetical protein
MSGLLSDDVSSASNYRAVSTNLTQRSGIADAQFPFCFSGLDYAVMLMSSSHVPASIKETLRNTLCWSRAPAASQLHDNLHVFLHAAHELIAQGLGGSEEAVLCVSGSLRPECLQQNVSCLSQHIAVQRWMASILAPSGPCCDPAVLREVLEGRGDTIDACPLSACPSCGNAELDAITIQRNSLRSQLMAIKALAEMSGDWDQLAAELRRHAVA